MLFDVTRRALLSLISTAFAGGITRSSLTENSKQSSRWNGRAGGPAFFQGDDLAVPQGDDLAAPYSITKRARYWITPADFGAVGSLSTADDDAMFRTINAAIKSGWNEPRPIFLEKGDILLTQSNILGTWDSIDTSSAKGVFGLTITGAGPYASRLVMQQDSNRQDKWFYDNQNSAGTGSSNNALLFPTFRDLVLTRQGTGRAKVHPFRLFPTPNGFPAQKFRFFNVHFLDVGTVMEIKGTVNGSENAWIGCHARGLDTFLDVSNDQAVNQILLGTDVERAQNDMFRITGASGLTVIGGSFIIDSNAPADCYILKVKDNTSGNFLLEALRCEMRSAHARICNLAGTDNSASVYIRSMSVRATTGGPRNSFVLDPSSKFGLVVEGCEFLGNHLVQWLDARACYEYSTARWARATFRNNIGLDRSMVTWGANAIGWTEIIGDQSGAMDFSGGGKGKRSGILSSAGNTDRIKVVDGWLRCWPCKGRDAAANGDHSYEIIIPIGSIIKSIHINKTAFGNSDSTYQLEVVDGDGIVIGQSTEARQKDRHTIDITSLWREVITANQGTIRVRYVAGKAGKNVFQTMETGDRFLVEYL